MRPFTTAAAPAVLAAVALALAGCTTTGPAASSTLVTSAATESMESSEDVMADDAAGSDAEDDASDTSSDDPGAFGFDAITVADGEPFDGRTLDNRDVILWFWAPWCPTCFAEAPVINAALPQMPDGVEIYGVAGLSGDLEYMQKFVDDADVGGITHIADLDGTVWQGFGVATQATIVVIDDSGDAYTLGAGSTVDDLVEYAEKIAAS